MFDHRDKIMLRVLGLCNIHFHHKFSFHSHLHSDPYVKVYLMIDGKKVNKKKTTVKKGDDCPIYNEAMIFSVPATVLEVRSLK